MTIFLEVVDKVDVNPTKWWLAGHKCTGWRVKLATLAQWKKDEKKTKSFRSQTKRGGSRNWKPAEPEAPSNLLPRSEGTKALSDLAFWRRFHASLGHRDLAWSFGIANSGQRGAVSDRREWCLVLQSRRSKSLGEREIFITYVYIVWSYV